MYLKYLLWNLNFILCKHDSHKILFNCNQRWKRMLTHPFYGLLSWLIVILHHGLSISPLRYFFKCRTYFVKSSYCLAWRQNHLWKANNQTGQGSVFTFLNQNLWNNVWKFSIFFGFFFFLQDKQLANKRLQRIIPSAARVQVISYSFVLQVNSMHLPTQKDPPSAMVMGEIQSL